MMEVVSSSRERSFGEPWIHGMTPCWRESRGQCVHIWQACLAFCRIDTHMISETINCRY